MSRRLINMLRSLGGPVTLLGVVLCLGAGLSSKSALAVPPPTGVPQYDAGLLKAIGWLNNDLASNKNLHGGYRSLPAYALLMAGEPVSSPAIQAAVDDVRKRITTERGYTPSNDQHHIYEAGVDLMLLAQAGSDIYKPDIDIIAAYVIAKQGSDGSWDYPQRKVGDTSMAQYAALGLWAATRVGSPVPLEVWDKAAAWHVKTQMQDGGFSYHPGDPEQATNGATGSGQSTLNMTSGGAGTLAICKLHLYPEAALPDLARDKKLKKKFGVLEEKATDTTKPVYAPQTGLSSIDASIQRALGWLSNRYRPITDLPHKIYYNYALERACAMNFVTQLGGKIDWFRSAGDEMMKLQTPAGSWNDHEGESVGTSFAVLFFIRPTKTAIAQTYGAGLLTAGRGLPDDLSTASKSGGAIKAARKPEGELDELLADLEKMDAAAVEETQTAIVEKVQLGNRDDLIGQIERIRTLIKHPSAEVRRTAAWALGRSSELRDANLLIQALEDNDLSVLIEVNNSLCYLSRKLGGVGLPVDPTSELPDNPPQEAIDAAVIAWRQEAVKRWSEWYFKVRPYADRNDVFQLQNQKKR